MLLVVEPSSQELRPRINGLGARSGILFVLHAGLRVDQPKGVRKQRHKGLPACGAGFDAISQRLHFASLKRLRER